MKTILIILIAFLAFTNPNLGLCQNPYEKGKVNVAKYISGLVSKSVYKKHFKFIKNPKILSYSLLPLNYHFDYYYDIVDEGDFVLEQLKFFTDTLGNVYTVKDIEWIG